MQSTRLIKNRRLWSITITVTLLIIMGWYLYTNSHIFKDIQKIEFQLLIPIYLVNITMVYINGLIIKYLAEPFKIKLKEHFCLSMAASFFNLITPFRGGAGVRALYMKKKYKLSYTNFLASLFGNYIIVFLVSSILALITFLILFTRYRIFNIFIVLIFSSILIGTLFFILSSPKFEKENFVTKRLNNMLKGWNIIKKEKTVVLKLALVTVTNILMGALMNYIALIGIGIEATAIQAIYLSIIGTLAIFLNITPGSLGIKETLYFVSANIVQISSGIGLIVALIIRGVQVSSLAVVGPISNYLLLKKNK